MTRPGATPPRGAPRGARAGFTLIELLVSLVLVVALGAVMMAMWVGQIRAFTRSKEASAMQRDLRMGLSLLPMDLRAASVSLGDLRSMTDTAIRLRATIGSSIACARPDASTIDIPPTGLAKNVLTSWYTEPKVGDWVTIYVSSDLDPSKDSWRLLQITSWDKAPASACPGAPFTDATLDPPATKPRYRITLSDTVSVAEAGIGKPIRFLRKVRYALTKAGSANRWYLGYSDSVDGAWSTTEPVAGPFSPYLATGPGVAFTYFDTTGAPLVNPPAGTRIGRVDVVLRTSARVRQGTGSRLVRDSVALRIALRNRQVQ
jgi:prepilin-type N-terminal cleavage/methylation domain-containing protein